MKRSPLRRTGGLKRGGSLKRTRMPRQNKERAAELRAVQFGRQADWCRTAECCVPVCRVQGCDPHHEPTRARGGIDKDTVPLCRVHHDERHAGIKTFETRYGIDLEEIARGLSLRLGYT